MSTDFEVWKGKDLSALFRDIYNNQRTTQSQITILIDTLKPLIKNSGDAAVIVPLIRDYLDVSVKNDSHLVRLAAIVERLYAAEKLGTAGEDNPFGLTEAEKQKLMQNAEEELKQIRGESKNINEQIGTTENSVKQLMSPIEQEDAESEEEDN